MTTVIIILAIVALIFMFTWLAIRAYNRDKWEGEKTERRTAWFDFRKWRRENGGFFGRRKNK